VPWEYVPLLYADRFHVLPSQVRALPLAELAQDLRIMGLEGEILSDLEGLAADETMYWEDE
jgi:hypothetical protein